MSLKAYLDYNATAPLRPQALAAAQEAAQAGGNASAVHAPGRAARGRLEAARAVIADITGFAPADVVFTSGGTEANHLALQGVRAASLLTSAIEHSCVLAAAPRAVRLPVTALGVVDLAQAEKLIAAAPAPALVSVMAVNNETGVIQPIPDILKICAKYRAFLHVDAVQALGRIPLPEGVDLLTLSAHKVGGPLGVGALLHRPTIELKALLGGGGQEGGRRSGTENVPGAVGFAVAAQAAVAELPEQAEKARWRDAFETLLREVPGARIIGAQAPRVANTTCVVCPGFDSQMQLMQLDLAGVAVSSGSACSSGKVARSHVLAAMGVEEAELASALRISFGWASSEAELKFCAQIWTQAALSAIKGKPVNHKTA